MPLPSERSWVVSEVHPAILAQLDADHVANLQAEAANVDILCDLHQEDEDGHHWALLRDAFDVVDVQPGSAVVVGTSSGRYLAKVVAWDFEVDNQDPIIKLEVLTVRPSEVELLLARLAGP